MTIDLVTHFPATDYAHNAIYVVVDKLPKFVHFIPFKHTVSDPGLA